ncbi:myosin-9-like [Centropristis striata]|uniref:myosin-9-like n=1 Tax=Centropristis striata TaxID=184440 RepID=UPI0027E1D506|nr:myosin-9-like [Centropristis striata]
MPGKKKKQGQRGIDAAAMLEFMNDCPTVDEFYHSPMEMQKNSLANKNNWPALANKNNTLTMPGKKKKQRGIDAAAMLESMNDDYSMEDEPPKKFYHSPMEMQKNTLANYMDQFRVQKDVKHQTCNTKDQQAELEQVKAESEALKDQLQSAKQQQQAVEKHNSELRLERNPWKLKAQLQAEKDKNSHLMASLEEAKQHIAQQEMEAKEHAKTREEVQALKVELQSAKQLQAVPKNNVDFELKKTQDLLEAERIRCEQEKNSIVQYTQNYVGCFLGQYHGQVDMNRKLIAEVETLKLELESAKQLQAAAKNDFELERFLEIQKAETQKLQHEFRKTEELLEKQKAETTRFAADLKKTQDLLETERHRFEQEKESIWKETQNSSTSSLAQLNGKEDENRKLMAEVETLKLELQSAKQQHAVEKSRLELQLESDKMAQLQAEKDKISHLMASLKEAEQDKSSLMAQLEKSKATHLAQQEMQTKENENTMTEMKKKLEDQLKSAKQLKAEKEALQNELEAKNNELRAEKRLIAVEKTKVEMELENSLLYEMAQLQAEKDKSSRLMASLKEAEQDKSSLLAQLDEKRRVNATIVAALKEVGKQLEIGHLQWQEDKTSLLAQLKNSQATYHAQSELQAEKHMNTVAALKKDLEDQLESSRLQWQQEKTSLLEESEKARESYVSQLEEKKRDNNTVVAALKEVEKQLKIGQLQWQEDKTSLTAQLVITNQRDTDLAEQIQSWEAKERGMREDNKYLEKRFRDQLAETKSWQDIALDQYSKRKGFWFGKKKIDDRNAELEKMKRKMQEKEEKNRIVHGDKVVEEAAACQ